MSFSVGNPELFVTSKTKTDSVYHLFDFNNKGPSELDFPTTLTVDYPSVVIDSKEILIVSNLVSDFIKTKYVYVNTQNRNDLICNVEIQITKLHIIN